MATDDYQACLGFRSARQVEQFPGMPGGVAGRRSSGKNALQQPAVLPRTASQPEMTNPTKPADCKALRESAVQGERAVSGSVVPTGFEPGDVTPAPCDPRGDPGDAQGNRVIRAEARALWGPSRSETEPTPPPRSGWTP